MRKNHLFLVFLIFFTLIASACQGSEDVNILVTVNGTPISEEEFRIYKSTVDSQQQKYSDDELLGRLIEQQLLFDEAKSRGLSVSDKEISDAIAALQEMLEEDSNAEYRRFIEAYISELGITEAEYWDSIRPAYERSLTIAKLQNELMNEIADKQGTDKISTDAFAEYYSDFTAELMKNADIVYT